MDTDRGAHSYEVPTERYSYLQQTVHQQLGQWRQGGGYNENHDGSYY